MTAPLLVALAALAAVPRSDLPDHGTARVGAALFPPPPQHSPGERVGERGASPAREVGRRSPVRVDADEVQYAFQKREVTFSGKRPVTLTRDDATLTCRKIVAVTDAAGQIVTASCTGDVRFVRGPRTVTCDNATFESGVDRVVCQGNAVMHDGGSEARGSRLVYDLRSDEAKLEGATITVPGEQIDERQRRLEARRKEQKR